MDSSKRHKTHLKKFVLKANGCCVLPVQPRGTEHVSLTLQQFDFQIIESS